jgi:hypothetical protein
VDDTIPPEFMILFTLEIMHNGFNGEDLLRANDSSGF